MEQELLTLPEHLSSHPGFSGALVDKSLVFCVVFCKTLIFLLSFFLLAIVLHVFFDLRLRLTRFGIFKLLLHIHINMYSLSSSLVVGGSNIVIQLSVLIKCWHGYNSVINLSQNGSLLEESAKGSGHMFMMNIFGALEFINKTIAWYNKAHYQYRNGNFVLVRIFTL